MFGLKGKLDATVQLAHQSNSDMAPLVTALELKTGREMNSHRGQVLLYALLLTERFVHSNN